MRPYVIINGVNSNTITGLIISKLPPVSKPQMRVLTEQIDGRDGDINTPLGFSAYDKPLEIGLTAEADVNEVIAYFNQAGEIIFSNEPDKYYNFAIYDAIDFEKLIRFKTATINLHTQPYKYSNTQGAIALNSGSNTVVNSGNTVSKPDLILEGSGVVNLSINNRQVIEADLTDVNKILIDSDTMNAYEATLINPIKSLKSDITPVQDLHGYSKPWIGGAGKNKLNNEGFFPTTASIENSYFKNFAVNQGNIPEIALLANTTYTLSLTVQTNIEPFKISVGCGSGGYSRDISSTSINLRSGRVSITFTPTTEQLTDGNIFAFRAPRYDVRLDATFTISDVQLEVGNQATAYEPYSNICPISGFSALNVTLADGDMQTVDTKTVNFGQTVYGGVADVTNGKVNVTHGYIDLGSLTWSKQTSVGGTKTYFRTASELSDCKKNTNVGQLQGLICSNYAEDTWSHTVDTVGYDSTICTGWTNRSYIAINDQSKVSMSADDFKTAMSGVMLCYELATPIEITTTPENLTAISGENNVFSDTNGDTEVTVEIDGEEQTLTGEIVTFNIDELEYELGAFANRIVTGNYDNIKLEVGSNNVELTGAFTDGQLTKYSRWL